MVKMLVTYFAITVAHQILDKKNTDPMFGFERDE